ncbi:C-type lectin domain family 2 member D11-like [Natator depressus]|uniref:C-type lectin domain family 2 member D11-like n=1 Tax=Natator depressus TaxID=27790 RepID=UPI003EC051B2
METGLRAGIGRCCGDTRARTFPLLRPTWERSGRGSHREAGRSAAANSPGGTRCEPAWLLGPQLLPRLRRRALFPRTERSRPQPSTCSSVCGLSVAERDNGASSWVAESEEPLQELCVNGNGHLETGGNPVLTSKLSSADRCPSCPDSWMGYRGKCYYFSETKGSWTDSRSRCSAPGASLAGIDSEQEMAFLLRHKGVRDHWIGLRREQGQAWKWANGTEFNHLFQIRGGGDCAYLKDEKGVSSSRCYMGRRWICSKPEVYVMGKETALEGGSK